MNEDCTWLDDIDAYPGDVLEFDSMGCRVKSMYDGNDWRVCDFIENICVDKETCLMLCSLVVEDFEGEDAHWMLVIRHKTGRIGWVAHTFNNQGFCFRPIARKENE